MMITQKMINKKVEKNQMTITPEAMQMIEHHITQYITDLSNVILATRNHKTLLGRETEFSITLFNNGYRA